MSEETPAEWSNWSGNVSSKPQKRVKPESEEAVREVIEQCRGRNRTLRVVGSGHSWTPLAATDDVLVSLDNMTGVTDIDSEAKEATVLGGTTLEEAAAELHTHDLAMANLGDVSQQTIAGAFGTGTHGTGPEFQNLSEMLIGGRIVTGTGDVRPFDAESDPEFLDAAMVSLGTLGVFTEMRLDLQPAYKLQRREYCARFEDFWGDFEALVTENRNFDFYWYPRSDEVKLRLLNGPGGGTDERDLEYAELVQDETGWWHQIIPEHDDIGREFEEMEYAVPRADAREFFLDVRDRIRDRWRADVGWRTLCRTVAADDAYLSAEHGRETVTVGFIQNAELEYWDYFEDLEAIAREYDGRPHWGKRHTLTVDELRESYPRFEDFLDFRREMDPDGIFLTDYLRDLLGIDSAESQSKRGETADGERA
ncbi:FAD-binding protein [Halobacteria archaeon AArc-curdl1]|uniref:FAD-binding protein n=1 Tax=Natronosalvus hydrolyticus TaxID=2979988 RepID=A0AAP2ZA80_9EURY|nr:FAD-binding protein [Halobacteria archaeon AArc-curdl1]